MKVILRTDVEKLGRAGDVKDVARGFARNYLFARKLAMEATPEAMAWFEKGKEKRAKLREKTEATDISTAKKLAGVSLSFTRQVGEQGKLFGSVGKSDIVKSLKASGHDVGKDHVVLESAIKAAGEFEVELRFSPTAIAKIKVSVLPRS